MTCTISNIKAVANDFLEATVRKVGTDEEAVYHHLSDVTAHHCTEEFNSSIFNQLLPDERLDLLVNTDSRVVLRILDREMSGSELRRAQDYWFTGQDQCSADPMDYFVEGVFSVFDWSSHVTQAAVVGLVAATIVFPEIVGPLTLAAMVIGGVGVAKNGVELVEDVRIEDPNQARREMAEDLRDLGVSTTTLTSSLLPMAAQKLRIVNSDSVATLPPPPSRLTVLASWGTRQLGLLEHQLNYFLATHQLSKASAAAIAMGKTLWSMKCWDVAESMWVYGARLRLGQTENAPIAGDPLQPKIIDVLIQEGIVVHSAMTDGEEVLLVTRSLGEGARGAVFKVFGETKALKEVKDAVVMASEMFFVDDAGAAEYLEIETSYFRAIESVGHRAPKVYKVFRWSLLREMIYGPTFYELNNPTFGLSTEEVATARAQFKVTVEELAKQGVLRDLVTATPRNLVYELATREWVVVDP